MAILYLITFVSYCASFFLIYCFEMTSAEKQFRKDSVLSHYYAGLILFILFGIVWVFAITGTQYNITGLGSTALQYVFGFLSMIHALLLVILTFARTSDTRSVFRPILRMIPGRTGKYDFAAESRGTQEAYGLDISGKYLTDETKTARADEKEPLAVVSFNFKYVYKKFSCHSMTALTYIFLIFNFRVMLMMMMMNLVMSQLHQLL